MAHEIYPLLIFQKKKNGLDLSIETPDVCDSSKLSEYVGVEKKEGHREFKMSIHEKNSSELLSVIAKSAGDTVCTYETSFGSDIISELSNKFLVRDLDVKISLYDLNFILSNSNVTVINHPYPMNKTRSQKYIGTIPEEYRGDTNFKFLSIGLSSCTKEYKQDCSYNSLERVTERRGIFEAWSWVKTGDLIRIFGAGIGEKEGIPLHHIDQVEIYFGDSQRKIHIVDKLLIHDPQNMQLYTGNIVVP